jgi:hypothetical protein
MFYNSLIFNKYYNINLSLILKSLGFLNNLIYKVNILYFKYL